MITLAAEYYVYRSGDGGHTWRQVKFYSGGASFGSLRYVNGTVGWMVVRLSLLLRTADAGRTWHRVAFTGLGTSAVPVTAYVLNEDSGTVTPIRVATNKALKPVKAGNRLSPLP